jgi:hypothetical protein
MAQLYECGCRPVPVPILNGSPTRLPPCAANIDNPALWDTRSDLRRSGIMSGVLVVGGSQGWAGAALRMLGRWLGAAVLLVDAIGEIGTLCRQA